MKDTYSELYWACKRALISEMEMDDAAARLESNIILELSSGIDYKVLLREPHKPLGEETAERVHNLLARRLAGEPMAYLAGTWQFCDLNLFVSPATLIPRVDTELLALMAYEKMKSYAVGPRILDLCAGSGCIGLFLASKLPRARVSLVEYDEAALEICRKNIREHRLSSRAVCVRGDARQPADPALGQFDLIVSNPPYIPTEDIAGLDVSVRDYEPHLALDGGVDGLDFYRSIINGWRRALKLGGYLMLEVGIGQAEVVAALLRYAGFENVLITRDTGGVSRVVEGRAPLGRASAEQKSSPDSAADID